MQTKWLCEALFEDSINSYHCFLCCLVVLVVHGPLPVTQLRCIATTCGLALASKRSEGVVPLTIRAVGYQKGTRRSLSKTS